MKREKESLQESMERTANQAQKEYEDQKATNDNAINTITTQVMKMNEETHNSRRNFTATISNESRTTTGNYGEQINSRQED